MSRKRKHRAARRPKPATSPRTGQAAGTAQSAAGVSSDGSIPSAGTAQRPLDRPRDRGGFNPDYSYVIKDLRRIARLAASLVGLLIVLSFFLR